MDNKGFTLIEIFIVIAIMGILAAITVPTLISSYRNYVFHGERDLAVSLLRRARGMSLAGTDSKDHGLKITSASYTIFEGSSWAARDTSQDQDTPHDNTVAISGGSEIVFGYLTGRSVATILTLTDGSNAASVSINLEGLISW